jgi:hypothetical protein
MSTIFELFGHRLDDDSNEAIEHREKAWCPFMGQQCDGGGNRYSTQIDLTEPQYEELKRLYPDRDKLMPGVCSLQVNKEQAPWIVCPRRLLVLGREKAGDRRYQQQIEQHLLSLLKHPTGTKLGIWSEVKIVYEGEKEGLPFSFDYTFDYILMPLITVSLETLLADVEQVDVITSKKLTAFRKSLARSGYQVEGNNVVDFPFGKPAIIEIMTSSTSGQNKSKRTQISQAFEDALVRRSHQAPGINYRQVWSRMVGQLFVKSEVALEWGGVTLWILQDLLVKYISATTKLDIRRFVSHAVDEVNILSFAYTDEYRDILRGVIELHNPILYSGKVANENAPISFTDIVRASVKPSYSKLINKLIVAGPPSNYVRIP